MLNKVLTHARQEGLHGACMDMLQDQTASSSCNALLLKGALCWKRKRKCARQSHCMGHGLPRLGGLQCRAHTAAAIGLLSVCVRVAIQDLQSQRGPSAQCRHACAPPTTLPSCPVHHRRVESVQESHTMAMIGYSSSAIELLSAKGWAQVSEWAAPVPRPRPLATTRHTPRATRHALMLMVPQ